MSEPQRKTRRNTTPTPHEPTPHERAYFSARWLLAQAEFHNFENVLFCSAEPKRRRDADARLVRIKRVLMMLSAQLDGLLGPEVVDVRSPRRTPRSARTATPRRRRRELPDGFRVIEGGAR